MITGYDKLIIGFYVVFMMSICFVFRGLSKNTSDYFRCGGAMPWWITGTSAWVATFSAWAFVGGAFAVLASDFVQMFLVMTISVVLVALVLRRPEIGGLAGLIDKVNTAHPAHLRGWLTFRPAILAGWGLAFTWVKFAELNS